MTKQTVGPCIGESRLDRLRVLSVIVGGAVTCLAGDPAVISRGFRRRDISVALAACVGAGVFDRKLGILNDGQGPVVAPESEAERDEQMPDHEVDNDDGSYGRNKVAYLFGRTLPHRLILLRISSRHVMTTL